MMWRCVAISFPEPSFPFRWTRVTKAHGRRLVALATFSCSRNMRSNNGRYCLYPHSQSFFRIKLPLCSPWCFPRSDTFSFTFWYPCESNSWIWVTIYSNRGVPSGVHFLLVIWFLIASIPTLILIASYVWCISFYSLLYSLYQALGSRGRAKERKKERGRAREKRGGLRRSSPFSLPQLLRRWNRQIVLRPNQRPCASGVMHAVRKILFLR